MRFNPFNKSISDVTAADLIVLKSIPEGWHVEYKRELPKPGSIAKSISAFANHYGGWLFYGIAEGKSGQSFPAGFPGIPNADLRAALEVIRSATVHHINPAATFEIATIPGPEPTLELSADHSIIAIFVPQGALAPYVHSSGRIYRRHSDSSEPVVETSRSAIDALFERGRERERRLADFYASVPTVSKAEEDNTYLHLFFMSDPWHEHEHRGPSSLADFAGIMRPGDPAIGGLPFDNCFPTAAGYIARQTRNNDPGMQVLTWTHFHDNSARVSIPINGRDWASFVAHASDRYSYADRFVRELRDAGHKRGSILDINSLIFLVAGCVGIYVAISKQVGITTDFYAKAYLENVWRRIPFLDMKAFLDGIVENGVPVIQDDDALVPPDIDRPNLIAMHAKEIKNAEPMMQNIVTSLPLLLRVFQAFGLDPTLLKDEEGEIFLAAQRSLAGLPKWEG